MKKLLLILFILIYTGSLAQDIEGLGPFKINKTTVEDVIKYLDDEKINNEITSDNYKIVSILRAHTNTSVTIPYQKGKNVIYGPMCEKGKEIIINRLNIANIEIFKIRLSFYDNVLYKITGDNTSELTDAFLLKYGDTNINREVEEKECLYKLTGITRILQEETFTRTWKYNKIVLTTILKSYYNEKCEKNGYNNFFCFSDIFIFMFSSCWIGWRQ